MNVKTYNDDDLRSAKYREEFPFEFVADIPGDNPDLLGDYDNHSILDRLITHGVIDKKTMQDDVESCCFYIYFTTKTAGTKFIEGLNAYLLQKANLVEAARSY